MRAGAALALLLLTASPVIAMPSSHFGRIDDQVCAQKPCQVDADCTGHKPGDAPSAPGGLYYGCLKRENLCGWPQGRPPQFTPEIDVCALRGVTPCAQDRECTAPKNAPAGNMSYGCLIDIHLCGWRFAPTPQHEPSVLAPMPAPPAALISR